MNNLIAILKIYLFPTLIVLFAFLLYMFLFSQIGRENKKNYLDREENAKEASMEVLNNNVEIIDTLKNNDKASEPITESVKDIAIVHIESKGTKQLEKEQSEIERKKELETQIDEQIKPKKDEQNILTPVPFLAVVTVDVANVRINPSTNAPIIAKSPYGREVTILNKNNGWAYITYKKYGRTIKGYILEKLLEEKLHVSLEKEKK